MKYLLSLYITALLAYTPNAGAQLFEAPSEPDKPQVVETPAPAQPVETAAPKVTAEQIIQQIEEEAATQPPSNMTPEEKALVKKPLVEAIIKGIDKADPRERRELLRAMKYLQTATVRRQNLALPDDQQVSMGDDIQVNPESADELRDYMLRKLVDPIDASMNIN